MVWRSAHVAAVLPKHQGSRMAVHFPKPAPREESRRPELFRRQPGQSKSPKLPLFFHWVTIMVSYLRSRGYRKKKVAFIFAGELPHALQWRYLSRFLGISVPAAIARSSRKATMCRGTDLPWAQGVQGDGVLICMRKRKVECSR